MSDSGFEKRVFLKKTPRRGTTTARARILRKKTPRRGTTTARARILRKQTPRRGTATAQANMFWPKHIPYQSYGHENIHILYGIFQRSLWDQSRGSKTSPRVKNIQKCPNVQMSSEVASKRSPDNAANLCCASAHKMSESS